MRGPDGQVGFPGPRGPDGYSVRKQLHLLISHCAAFLAVLAALGLLLGLCAAECNLRKLMI